MVPRYWVDFQANVCLLGGMQVELIEQPFTVISLTDVNLVNLERVGFGLRNFDMAIVPKVRPHAVALKSQNIGMLRGSSRPSHTAVLASACSVPHTH